MMGKKESSPPVSAAGAAAGAAAGLGAAAGAGAGLGAAGRSQVVSWVFSL